MNTYHIVMRFFIKRSKIKERLPITTLRKLWRSLPFSIATRTVAVDSIMKDLARTITVDLIIKDLNGTVIADSIMKDLTGMLIEGQIMGDHKEHIKNLNLTILRHEYRLSGKPGWLVGRMTVATSRFTIALINTINSLLYHVC